MTSDPIPYGRQSVDDDDVRAVVGALRSDWLTTGPAVEAFESALSDVVGGHPTVAVNSGTAALHAAYAAASVGPGAEIVTSPLTFVATAAVAVQLGATVRFADVEDGTLTLDPEAALRAVTEATRAIVPVDFAGQPADLDAFRHIADEHELVLVEDAAHAIGGRYRGRPVGDVADLTCFSFHPVKTVTTGEGGAVVVRRRDLEDSVRRFRSHGLVRDEPSMRWPDEGGWHQEVHEFGLNYRLPDINAALGLSQLSKLERFVRRRAELVARYRDALAHAEGLRLLEVRPDAEPAWHLFPVRILGGRRREVFDRMREDNIGVQVHYLPAHRHPVFVDMGYTRGSCPVAERAYEELISLPLFPDLKTEQQDRVIGKLLDALEG